MFRLALLYLLLKIGFIAIYFDPVQENGDLIQLLLSLLSMLRKLVCGKDSVKLLCLTLTQSPYHGTCFRLFTTLSIVAALINLRMK